MASENVSHDDRKKLLREKIKSYRSKGWTVDVRGVHYAYIVGPSTGCLGYAAIAIGFILGIAPGLLIAAFLSYRSFKFVAVDKRGNVIDKYGDLHSNYQNRYNLR